MRSIAWTPIVVPSDSALVLKLRRIDRFSRHMQHVVDISHPIALCWLVLIANPVAINDQLVEVPSGLKGQGYGEGL